MSSVRDSFHDRESPSVRLCPGASTSTSLSHPDTTATDTSGGTHSETRGMFSIGQEQQKSTINVHPDKVASMSIAAGKQVHQPQDSQGAVEPAKPRKPMESSSGGGTSTFEQEHRPQIRVHHPPGGASSFTLC
eukprot:Lankesteria_metandrocarpae@DN5102_c0_g1_i1.p1